jgi:hypothetical protein
MTDSQTLLAEYARSGSESAFRDLVTRYVGLVYSNAVRLVDGDTHLAEDVSQTVFLDLARKARSLSSGVMLGGWLHQRAFNVAGPLILAAALNLDFLCIHPFRDGNGRASRLLFLLACYHCGIEAGRYVSLERIIEDNKERYYEVLEQSSQRWHEGKHDAWPAMNFLLFVLAHACKEFEQRLGRIKSPRGEKTEAVIAAVGRQVATFRVAGLQAECPGVGLDLIRRVLARLQKEKKIRSLGTGRGAKWEKVAN